MAQTAVLMMAYGGPGSLDDVQAYLLDVRGGRATPDELVEEVKARYAAIGGKSPLLEITLAQAGALEERLNLAAGNGCYRVFVGMRHWFPYIREAVQEITRAGIERVTAVCMTPYYSAMSTQAYLDQLDSALESAAQDEGGVPFKVQAIRAWHTNPLFIQALVEKTAQTIRRFPEATGQAGKLVFTAHSLPAALIEQGDPYEPQLLDTARAVARGLALADDRWEFCYQSAGARNTRWLGPSLAETLTRLSQEDTKFVLVAPIGFVADHVEILYDIDVEAKRQADGLGMRLERTEALNTDAKFIEALAQIVTSGGSV